MGAFRRGAFFGLAAGYVLGARAGRARYDQIVQAFNGIKSSPAIRRAYKQAGRVLGTGLHRGRLVAVGQLERLGSKVAGKKSFALKKPSGNGHR